VVSGPCPGRARHGAVLPLLKFSLTECLLPDIAKNAAYFSYSPIMRGKVPSFQKLAPWVMARLSRAAILSNGHGRTQAPEAGDADQQGGKNPTVGVACLHQLVQVHS
jgi:hypothetical protein